MRGGREQEAEGGEQPAPGPEWAEAAGTPTQPGDKGLPDDRLCAHMPADTDLHFVERNLRQTTDVDVGATLPCPWSKPFAQKSRDRAGERRAICVGQAGGGTKSRHRG